MKTLDEIKRIRDQVRNQLSPWNEYISYAGITKTDNGEWAIAIGLSKEAPNDFPKEILGVPIVARVVAEIKTL